jgi:carboxyl-terminal processing protease
LKPKYNTMFNKKIYNLFYFILIFLTGILLGQALMKNTKSTTNNHKINNVLQYIADDYVDSVAIYQIEETAVEDILSKLDPHSVYISEEEFHAANDPLLGKFDGIGIQFRMVKDSVVVILPLENGPSQKAGILAGDRIVIANNDTLVGKKFSSFDIQKRLKGKKGSQINLLVKRNGVDELLKFSLKRAAIPTYSIDANFMLDDTIGYIKLSRFSASTIKEFGESMENLIDAGMKKLILDLRGNSGGYLGASIYIADQFLEKGRLIVYTEGRNRPKQSFKASRGASFSKGDLIILMDQNSASASEIVAGAIQDNDRGIIVGRRSFGKGLVQEQMNYTDGSAVRLTVARYYTPSGRSIQRPYENGNEEYFNDYYKRIHKESLIAPDSLSIPDSLKYKTLEGRTVYGGGGIWPDHFMSTDTSINFSFYNRLLNQSIIYQFAFDYVDQNRKKLASLKSVNEFISDFKEDETLYKLLINSQEVKKLKPSKKELQDSKLYILNLLKAEIARNLYFDGFYQVFLQNDKFIEEALKLWKN